MKTYTLDIDNGYHETNLAMKHDIIAAITEVDQFEVILINEGTTKKILVDCIEQTK